MGRQKATPIGEVQCPIQAESRRPHARRPAAPTLTRLRWNGTLADSRRCVTCPSTGSFEAEYVLVPGRRLPQLSIASAAPILTNFDSDNEFRWHDQARPLPRGIGTSPGRWSETVASDSRRLDFRKSSIVCSCMKACMHALSPARLLSFMHEWVLLGILHRTGVSCTTKIEPWGSYILSCMHECMHSFLLTFFPSCVKERMPASLANCVRWA